MGKHNESPDGRTDKQPHPGVRDAARFLYLPSDPPCIDNKRMQNKATVMSRNKKEEDMMCLKRCEVRR